MTLCNLLKSFGPVPKQCPDQQEYLHRILRIAAKYDQLRYAEDDHYPTVAELNALYDYCGVPDNALVTWQNTDASNFSQWLSPDGVTWIATYFPTLITPPYYTQIKAYAPLLFPLLYETAGVVPYDSSGNGYNGIYTNCTLSNVVGPDGGAETPSLNGTTSLIDFSGAGIGPAFNGNTGSLHLWIKASAAGVWTDGATRTLVYIFVNANNQITINKSSTNNRITFQFIGGGTTDTINADGIAGTNWISVGFKWDRTGANAIEAYINGVSAGTSPTLGTWVGLPGTIMFGSTGAAQYWSGSIGLPALWTTPLATAAFLDMATV